MSAKKIVLLTVFIAGSLVFAIWFLTRDTVESDPQVDQIKKTLTGFSNAVISNDQQAICSYLDPQLIKQYQSSLPKHIKVDFCKLFADSVKNTFNNDPSQSVTQVEESLQESIISVKGNKATVTRYVNQKRYFLFKMRYSNGQWYIMPS
jgi:hypothetical protein